VTETSELPLPERAKRYRELAADAETFASKSKELSVRESSAIIAKQWRRLAEEIEAQIKRAKR
jgi:hypothetical protein